MNFFNFLFSSNSVSSIKKEPLTADSTDCGSLERSNSSVNDVSSPNCNKLESTNKFHTKIFRKNRKFLTTCKLCGHYRFVRTNSKRVINPAFPYEHSAKGGCTVESINRIPLGERLRRMCICEHCTNAAKQFVHEAPGNKKTNQYNYPRTRHQSLLWKDMKRQGWRCRYGRYFGIGESINSRGMLCEDAFIFYENHRNESKVPSS